MGLAAAVAAAPQLVEVASVRDWLLSRATAGLPVSVRLETARLRWWNPVELHGVGVTADGAPLARVESIRSDAPLWQLVASPSRPGTWVIEGAELELALRPDGSNWEDVLARLPAGESATGSAGTTYPSVAIAVRDATVRISATDRDLTSASAQPVVLEDTQVDLAFAQPIPDAASADSANTGTGNTVSAGDGVRFSGSGRVRSATPEVSFEDTPAAATDAARPHWHFAGNLQPAAPHASIGSSAVQLRGSLQLDGLPLRLINPLATRMGIRLDASGAVEGSLDGLLVIGDGTGSAWRLEPSRADLQVQDMAVRSPLWSNETIASGQVRLSAECSLDDTKFAMTRAELATDWLDANLRGSIDLAGVSAAAATTSAAVAWPAACRDLVTQGKVQVAPLATQLPKTLSLRDGLVWKAGQLAWELRKDTPDGSGPFVGKLSMEGLAAEQGTERYALTDPVRAEFRWSGDAGQARVEQLTLQSGFLTLQGQGDLRQGQLQGRADLGRLTREVRQFVELGDQQGAGQVEAQVAWQDVGGGAWRATARGVGSQLRWSAGPVELWSEPALNVEGGIEARLENDSIGAVEAGELHVVAGTDRLDAVLREPARAPWSDASVSLDAKLSGQLANWQNRLRPFVDWQDWQLRGELQSSAQLSVSPRRMEVQNGQLQLRQAAVAATGRQWQEPAVQLQLQGSYDWQRGQLDCPRLTLASTSVSLQADQLAWPPIADRSAMQVQYRGDLARVWQHVAAQFAPQSTGSPRGLVAGRLQLVPQGNQWTCSSVTRVQDFQWETLESPVVARGGRSAPAKPQLVWQEPVIDLNLDGQWLPAEQTVRVQRAALVTSAAQVQLQGDLQPLSAPLQVRLQGTTRLDLDQLTARLKPLYGDQIRLTGAVDRPFSLQGPLRMTDANASAIPVNADTAAGTATRLVTRTPAAPSPVASSAIAANAMSAWVSPELQGAAGLGWQSAHAFGFDLSAAAIDARLQQQTVAIQPLDLQLSGGKLHVEPRLQLQGAPTLELVPGRVLEQVTITPAMCQGWLKYVAPLVADAASAEGRFSADVGLLNLPLLDPDSTRMQGVLGIHAARIGPGPLATELLTLVDQVRAILDGQLPDAANNAKAANAWVTFPEQQVPVRMEDGRVAHEGLTMLLGDIPVKTQGWVGMDNQLSLIAEIPIQESWLRDERWLAGLKGQTLRIPVRGSVQRPQLDRSILQQLGQTAVRGAAQGLLQDEVQRQMNKLLPDLLQRGAPRN